MNKQNTWHFEKWSSLGWLETGIKLIAFSFAWILLGNALNQPNFVIPNRLFIAIWIIQIFLSFGLLTAIFDRWLEKDIISMIFVLFNNIAHWGIVFVLGVSSFNKTFLFAFFILMLIGDLIKLIFIHTSNFSVRDLPRSALYILTGTYIAGYIIQILLLAIS